MKNAPTHWDNITRFWIYKTENFFVKSFPLFPPDDENLHFLEKVRDSLLQKTVMTQKN